MLFGTGERDARVSRASTAGMIPTVVAAEVAEALRDFLRTGFAPSNPELAHVIDDFLAEPANLARGPYLSLALPFRKSPGPEPFPEVPLGFTPYHHQRTAMERLANARGESTLIATGTGSGKTECYLLPILDHCREQAGKPGVKAILVYPMNALAMDQAARIAGAVHRSPALRHRVTAGLYVGGRERTPRKTMTAQHVVTDRHALRASPPDILLTNYKMLDYLMIRPGDQRLWRHNGPGALRYLVVDELHTFDGAQGTDLACLIRRLRARLRAPDGGLVCVGTSATLGTGNDEPVREYASRVFNQEFAPGSVVGEIRQPPEAFLDGSLITGHLSRQDGLADNLDPRRHDGAESYLRAAHETFFGEPLPGDFDSDGWRIALADRLREHTAFRNLLQVLGGEPKSLPDVAANLRRTLPVESDEDAAAVLNALCALVSAARLRDGDRLRPFLEVGAHLWVRELGRMVCSVREADGSPPDNAPPLRRLRHSDDLQEPGADEGRAGRAARAVHLPLVQCRECRVTGWAAVKRAHETRVESDLRVFYNMFFRRDPDVRFLFPGDAPPRPARSAAHLLCGACGWLAPAPSRGLGEGGDPGQAAAEPQCPSCHSDRVERLRVPDAVKPRSRGGKKVVELSRDCPYCGADEGLILFGARAASLISVLCSQTFASRHNADPKALAFSDNVQNAAHRAGFVAARSRQTHTRAAIAKVVAGNDGASLERLPGMVARHWRERAGSDENFVGEHIADDRRWMRDVAHLEREGTLPPGSDLPRLVARRLEWETLREFTFGSGIGRTLERTGAAAVALDRERVLSACDAARQRIREEVGGLRGMGEEAARALVLGTMRRMKDRGAARHSLANRYLGAGANVWATWQRDPALPRFGPRSLIPVFPVCGGGHPPKKGPLRGAEPVFGADGRRSWYRRWCDSVLARESALGPAESEQVLRLVFRALEEAGLASRVASGRVDVWALEPSRLSVTTSAVFLHPEPTGRPLTVAADDVGLWEDVPRLDGPPGSSRYRRRAAPPGPAPAPPDPPTWFGRLYRRGKVRRIVAAEHTALVERAERERLQRVFAKPHSERRPWEPNLVSATPTLELGIDIGDLSAVTLCAVPPGTASYRQRAGRAGRRDGNALVLTVANAEPRDLYFYAEPTDMLAGGVDPPGVFLDAVAVLERQLTAFCLDNWVASGIPEDAVPPRIGTVLTNVEKNRQSAFPHPFFAFARNRGPRLIKGFLDAFAGDLRPSSRESLRRFLLGDVGARQPSLIIKIHRRLEEAAKERKAVAADIRSLGGRIGRLRARPRDEATEKEIKDLEDTRKGLRSVHRKINGRNTFNFLTDEGLVPNYAFPEEGVKLRSIILEKRRPVDGGDGSEARTITHEYERPAAMALGEFAPENRFYARAHQVEISRVDTRVSEMERWRMCPTCVYAEKLEEGDGHAACPRCGDIQWRDRGQLHNLLRLRLVHAVASGRESRIDDRRDDREHLFYTRNLVADFDPADIRHAYASRGADAPFGFEHIPSATFREVNFGRLGQPPGRATVAGMRLPREGFRICKRCGTVNGAPGSEPEHMPACPARRSGEREIVDCLYLYREFRSEAIRMLPPLSGSSDEERRERSFVAALELGLRRRFGGQIGHLRAMTCSYPVEGSDPLQRYVLLYDTVPGGTGYLKDRMTEPGKLLEVLEAALAAIEECPCGEDPERDGCHRCVLGYRRSRDMRHTSRETAREMLRAILDARDELELVAGGLRKVPVPVPTGSALEDRFVQALRLVAEKGGGGEAALRYDLVDGKPGYVLRVGAGGGVASRERSRGGPDREPGRGDPARRRGQSWYVAPQVDVGLADGVAPPSRPDFLIRPAKASAAHPPVAVFLDGFEHHRDRVHDDSAKRMALVRAGFVVWSATSDDVDKVLGEAKPANVAPQVGVLPGSGVAPGRGAAPPIAAVQQRLDARWDTAELRSALDGPALLLLGRYLADPDPKRWRRAVFTRMLGGFDPADMGSAELAGRFAVAAEAALPDAAADALRLGGTDGGGGGPAAGSVVCGGSGRWRVEEVDASGDPDLLLALPPAALKTFDDRAMFAAVHLRDDDGSRSRDGYRTAWQRSLRLFNLLQFLPRCWWTTTRGAAAGLYDELPIESRRWPGGVSAEPGPDAESAPGAVSPPGHTGFPSAPGPMEDDATAAAWRDALRFAAPELRDALTRLRDLAAPPPEIGFELLGPNGAVLGEAEAAWPDRRVGVLMSGRDADRTLFESRGWRVVLAAPAPALASALTPDLSASDLAESLAALLAGDPPS